MNLLAFPGPAYRVETARTVIRCWNPADAPLLKAAVDASVEHLRPWMPWADQEPTDLQAKIDLLRRFRGRFDLGEDFTYGILDRAETQVLGGTGLHTRVGEEAREIGYWIHAAYINQGLATEVAAALTRVAFEIDRMSRVEIRCDARNVRSAAVPRKLGYTLETTLRQRITDPDGSRHNVLVWTLLVDEYPASPAAAAALAAYDAVGRQLL